MLSKLLLRMTKPFTRVRSPPPTWQMGKLRQRGTVIPAGHTSISVLSSSEKKTVQDPQPHSPLILSASPQPEPSAPGRRLERPESSPPPDGGGRGLRATAAAAAARGDAGTPGGGVSAGKTEEIKTSPALLFAAPRPPPPAGAWADGWAARALRFQLPRGGGPGAGPWGREKGPKRECPAPTPS